MSASAVDGDCEQCLADEVEQGADRVDRQQDAEYPQDCPRLLVEVLQVEQSDPEWFLGGGVVGDEAHGERGLRDPVMKVSMLCTDRECCRCNGICADNDSKRS